MNKELFEKIKKIEELGLKERIELFKEILAQARKVETDADCDGSYVTAYIHKYRVEFYSYYDYSIDINDEDETKEFCKSISADIEEDEEYTEEIKVPVAILNTSILTSEGTFKLKDIDLEDAKNMIKNNKDSLLSAVGHQSTADILTTLLNTKISMNRINFVQEVNQKALVFKLLGRPEEGKILTEEEINKIGYKFQLLERIS